jgi:hypothetical protein
MGIIAKSVDVDKLVGLKANLYYCNLVNSFQLGSVIFEVIEDENDGYRSSFQELQVVRDDAEKRDRDFLAEVQILNVEHGEFKGYQVTGTDGHVWVEFGTDYADDYYPCFVFNTTPKPPKV